MSTGAPPERPPTADARPFFRRASPFVLAIGLIAFVVHRIDLHAFARHLAEVNAPAFLLFSAVFLLALLTADAFATAAVYRRARAPVTFREIWILRGASYLPSVLNHHVGQAFVTYYLSRAHAISLARMAGATLLVYVSWAGSLLGVACVALFVTGQSYLWIAAVLGAGLAYPRADRRAPRAPRRDEAPRPPLPEAGIAGRRPRARGAPAAPRRALPRHVDPLLHFFGVRIPVGPACSRTCPC